MNALADITPDHAWTGTVYVDVTNPRPEDIHLEDIAVGLARESRYGGRATFLFWSVAQHSLLVHHMAREDGVDDRLLLAVLLMHDAPEYLLRDMIRPVKRNVPGYGPLEEVWWRAISTRFDLPYEWIAHGDVKRYDDLAVAVEKKWLIDPACGSWPSAPDPGDRRIPPELLHADMGFVGRKFESTARSLGLV